MQTLDTDPLPVREKFVEHELGIVRRLHEAKVRFLAGTDTPAGVDVIPGISLHLELQRFVAAGFTPLEALQTATLNPAKFYGKTKDFGTVEQGRIADLVLLPENPLKNIANTRTVTGVIADGRYISQEQLDEMKTKLRALAATR
jgi:imidazolonepropionase-like amidohydrolase